MAFPDIITCLIGLVPGDVTRRERHQIRICMASPMRDTLKTS